MQSRNLQLLPEFEKLAEPGEPRSNEDTHAHAVQFYESEAFLTATVADFLAQGLAAGQPVLVIAGETLRDACTTCFAARGFDVERLQRTGRLTSLDDRATLARFMTGSVPDAARFQKILGGTIDVIRRTGGTAPVRAFGEMADLLWKEGRTAAALRVEELWNDLARRHAFSLLCAYAMGNFHRSGDARDFQSICNLHSHVVPTEQFTQIDEAARLGEVCQLQQRARALEAEIASRELLEVRLREALREAESASRARSEFLAAMSHELRTPLNAIGGHVQLLELGIHGPLTDAQRESLARVARSQRHLLALINDVLNLTRLGTGHVAYHRVEFQVAPLLREVASMLEPMLREARLHCAIAGGGASPPISVLADREKVQQVLVNVLTNAIRFTPPEGAISCDVARGAPGMVEIRVRDTGVGIEPEKLESIFEPFVQLEKPPFGRQDGVGLGLAISRDLARGMSGELAASSVVGAGTTITLVLPESPRAN